MGRWLSLVAGLVAAFILFHHSARTPAPAPASAPAAEFSAGRAMVDIAAMAPVAHPIGSPANARVRDYLLRRMTELGLTPRIQRAESHGAPSRPRKGGGSFVLGADVENVIGVLPGRSRTAPALALMAHYDSVRGSPGAADDITGVASALEILRAIKTQGTPARDVMLVITDGEEAGLLGANAFFNGDPQAARVGFVLNMESRGGGGRATMFQTGPDNGPAIDLYARTAISPESNSLAAFVYKVLPNDTDYTVAKAKGVAGLNYAFIGRQFDYHSPSSTVAVLDQGSVQHMGAQVLGTARALAFAARLPGKGPDAVYANAPGGWLIVYPAWGGWILLAVTLGLILIASARARRKAPLTVIDGVKGAGAGLLVVVAGALVLHLVRHATGFAFGWIDGRGLLARFPTYELAMALAGVSVVPLVAGAMARGGSAVSGAIVALLAGLAASLFGGFDVPALGMGVGAAVLALILLRRPASLAGSWIGLMGLALAAATALQILAPTTAMVIAWPLAAAALCAVLTGAGAAPRRLTSLIAWVIVVAGLAWVCGLFHSLLQGLDVPEPPALTVLLAGLLIWPMAWPSDPSHRPRPSGADLLLITGLGLALWLHVTSPWSPRHPAIAMPLYVVDHDAGRSWRVSPYAPDAWTRGVLSADGGAIERRRFPAMDFTRDGRPSWAAPAGAVQPPAFALAVTRAPDGLITLHAPMDGQALLDLRLRSNTLLTDGRINGKPSAVLTTPGQWTTLIWQAAPEGVTVSFRPVGPGALDIQYAAVFPRWPATAKPLPPMPPKLMAWDIAGSTVVVGSQRTTW